MMHINQDIGRPPRLEMVPIDQIIVDSTYQRDVVKHRVRSILKSFRWRDFQPVTLADQGDGTYCVIDGQHRVHAARLHPDVQEIPAAIVDLEGQKKSEAQSFVVINTARTAVTPVDRYWAALEAEDAEAMRTRDVLKEAGCDIVSTMGEIKLGKTNAVVALQKSISAYGDVPVRRALAMLRRAWPKDPQALMGIYIRSLARIVFSSENFSDDAMVQVLARQNRTEISSHAEAMRAIAGGSSQTLVARVLAEQYNKGRRKNLAYFGSEGGAP